MKKILVIITLFTIAFYSFAEPNDCVPVLIQDIHPGMSIEKWDDEYESCAFYEWHIYFPETWDAVEFDYILDLNPMENTDALMIYVPGDDGEEEILGYAYQPITGKMTIRLTDNKTARVVFLSEKGNSGELYRGFKLSYREGEASDANQVLYNNVGIGIQPQERLHVNGAIRGDGESGSLRIRTTAGTTEIGAADSVYSHFYTDRSAYFFNKPLYVAGGTIAAYGMPNSLKFQTDNTNRMVINSDGDIELFGDIYLNGTINGADKYNQSTRIQSQYGYADIGAVNTGYFHFYTDRPGFYFGSTLTINGGKIRSASGNNLYLNTFDQTRMTILQSNGNVGIGTNEPKEKLHVAGAIRGDGVNGEVTFKGDNGYLTIGASDSQTLMFNTDKNKLAFTTNGTTHLTIQSNGNVGIGTTDSNYKLDVNGTIRANEIIVNTTGADFVFAEDYQLRSLSEVKAFITENKHLPEIKSAQEMQENGVGINELQTQLLQKIEELTLYIIHQEERINALEAELNK